VLLADDHRIVAEGLKGLLDEEFELLDIVEDGRALVTAARELRPDVIVADISMPHLNGLDALAQLQRDNPKVRVVFLTMHREVAYARRALDAGALGFVLKTSAHAELVLALRAALQGRTFVGTRPRRGADAHGEGGRGQPGRSGRGAVGAPARDPAAGRRGKVGQGDRAGAGPVGAHRRGPQVPHDGIARHREQRRSSSTSPSSTAWSRSFFPEVR
jgi:CheY-like chemotaxis protein